MVHELTHNKFYAKGQAVFNESFASFVGARGAERFFASRGDTSSARRTAARWHDDLLLGGRVGANLSLAGFRVSRAPGRLGARGAARRRATRCTRARGGFSWIRWVRGSRPIDPRYAARVRLDNAALLARLIYATGLRAVREPCTPREGDDIRRALERIIRGEAARPLTPGVAASRGYAAEIGPGAAPAGPPAGSRTRAASGSADSGRSTTTRCIPSRTPRSMKRESWSIE